MNLKRSDLKQRAVALIRSARPSVILVALAYTALSVLMYLLSNRLMGINFTQADMDRYMQLLSEGNLDYAMVLLEDMTPPASSAAINTLLQILLAIVDAGFILFLLNTIRGTGACLGNLLDGFGFFFKIILLSIVQYIFIALWSLLLVFPGIIAAYRYRMAIYLLVDDPGRGVMECIRLSKEMMKDHKWELFVLDLSFIGWNFLAMLPVIGWAIQIWTMPYISLTYALYFENRSGRDIYAAQSGGAVPPPWEFQ